MNSLALKQINSSYSSGSQSLEKHTSTIVFIDEVVEDYTLLMEGVIPGAETFLLDRSQDGVAQISAVLKNRSVDSCQIITHGSSANLRLGSSQLSLENIRQYCSQIKEWQVRDLLLYACEVANGEGGTAFLEELHQLTGANIAASAQKIGNNSGTNRWDLEVEKGAVASALALTSATINVYSFSLGLFGGPDTYAISQVPQSVSIGDFNGDGVQDLVVSNTIFTTESERVSILLGNGDGSFKPESTYATVVRAFGSQVVIADFNGDNKQDIFTCDGAATALLIGNGDGSFSPQTTFATVANVNFDTAISEDFNGDGKTDVALTDTFNGVYVLLGDGIGGFSRPTTIPIEDSRTTGIVSGDFNGDGKVDLATVSPFSRQVSILLGNGSGGFSSPTTFAAGGGYPSQITTGDFNGDGKVDLAVSSNNTTSILLGTGSGGFANQLTFSSGVSPNSIVSGDFNGDGKTDLAETFDFTRSGNIQSVSIILGNGDGSFLSPSTFATKDSPEEVAVGDFNGDGKPDLVTVNSSLPPYSISVLLNGTKTSPTLSNQSPLTTNNFTTVNTNFVFSSSEGNALVLEDMDVVNKPIQVSLSASNGILTLGNVAGLTVSGNGTANVTLTGSITDINIGLDGLNYSPSQDFKGSNKLTLIANDLGNTGSGKVQSTTYSGFIAVNAAGSSAGDPHLVTFDGFHYDFQALGDFVLVKALDSDLEVQVRQLTWDQNASVTLNVGLATVVAGNRVEFYKDQSQVLVNGISLALAEGETKSLGKGNISRSMSFINPDHQKEVSTFIISYPNGDQLTASIIDGILVDPSIMLSGSSKVVGLLGNNDNNASNDLALNNGTVLLNPLDSSNLYGAFADSWRVDPAVSLFTAPSNPTGGSVKNTSVAISQPSETSTSQPELVLPLIDATTLSDGQGQLVKVNMLGTTIPNSVTNQAPVGLVDMTIVNPMADTQPFFNPILSTVNASISGNQASDVLLPNYINNSNYYSENANADKIFESSIVSQKVYPIADKNDINQSLKIKSDLNLIDGIVRYQNNERLDVFPKNMMNENIFAGQIISAIPNILQLNS